MYTLTLLPRYYYCVCLPTFQMGEPPTRRLVSTLQVQT